MTWKPAGTRACVHAARWAAIASPSRYRLPQQSGASSYGRLSHAVCEPSAPSTNRSPASPLAPVVSMSDCASAAVVTASPQ